MLAKSMAEERGGVVEERTEEEMEDGDGCNDEFAGGRRYFLVGSGPWGSKREANVGSSLAWPFGHQRPMYMYSRPMIHGYIVSYQLLLPDEVHIRPIHTKTPPLRHRGIIASKTFGAPRTSVVSCRQKSKELDRSHP